MKETHQQCIYHNIFSFPHTQLCLQRSFKLPHYKHLVNLKDQSKIMNTCSLTTVYVLDVHSSLIGTD